MDVVRLSSSALGSIFVVLMANPKVFITSMTVRSVDAQYQILLIFEIMMGTLCTQYLQPWKNADPFLASVV